MSILGTLQSGRLRTMIGGATHHVPVRLVCTWVAACQISIRRLVTVPKSGLRSKYEVSCEVSWKRSVIF